MILYWAILSLAFFNLFWLIVSVTTSIDLTLVGHLRGWKRIHYPRWLGGFIEEKRKGYEILTDFTSHPQVLMMLGSCLTMLVGFIVLTICVWFKINSIEPSLLCIINTLLYVPTAIWLLISKIKVRKELRMYYQSLPEKKEKQ